MAVFFVLLSAFPMRHYDLAKEYSQRYGVDVCTVMAVIYAESGGDPAAVSNKGAMGLMQLMPSTARWIADRIGMDDADLDLFNPRVSVQLGTYYLAYLKGRVPPEYVIAAYNAGEGNVQKWLQAGGDVAFAETRNYVQKVAVLTEFYKVKLKILQIFGQS